jgi:hypothetical protein
MAPTVSTAHTHRYCSSTSEMCLSRSALHRLSRRTRSSSIPCSSALTSCLRDSANTSSCSRSALTCLVSFSSWRLCACTQHAQLIKMSADPKGSRGGTQTATDWGRTKASHSLGESHASQQRVTICIRNMLYTGAGYQEHQHCAVCNPLDSTWQPDLHLCYGALSHSQPHSCVHHTPPITTVHCECPGRVCFERLVDAAWRMEGLK